MNKFEHFVKMAHEFSHVADFVIVYIMEAHPTDGWAFNNNGFSVAEHKTLEDRIAIAKILEERANGIPLIVDGMSNEANVAYGAVPERLYIIQSGRVVYQGGQGPVGYKVNEVNDWLTKNCSAQ